MEYSINRSTVFITTGCAKRPCREKEPIPQEKIYSQRTAEIGVYIDKALYQQMAVSKNMITV